MGIRGTYLGLFVALVQCSSCDPIDDNGGAYIFSVTATIPHANDTISIGDTLYLTSSFATKLTDTKTGDLINYSNAQPIGGGVGFNDFTKIGTTTDSSGTTNFLYFPIEGDVYSDKTVPMYWTGNQTRYEEKNGSYYLKIGMIPKKKGMYALTISDPYSNGLTGTNNFTTSARFIIKFANTNQHLQYYEKEFPQFPLSDHDKGHIYCFVVR